MMQKLPYKDFIYTTTSLDEKKSTPDDSDHGYYIVCDINYTNSSKEKTEQLALMLYQRKIIDNELGYRERDKGKARSEKLILHQNNKTEYMVHYRMLKFYVKMGASVTKIHKVIKFKEDYICREYIQNKTNKRATANTEAEKDVRKLMNNSLYGRMCVNALHFLQSKFLHDEEKIMKSISQPTFKNINRYNDYSQIEYLKKEYDSPVYVGVTILELSKLRMYDVFYKILQPSLKDLQLHYMDTNSFILSFSEGNVDNEHTDLSNLEPPIKTINKVPVKFKQKLGSRIIEEFIALSPMTYSFKDYSNNTKEKGIKIFNHAKQEEYYNTLMYNKERVVQECRIEKVGDNVTTTKTSKINLNTFDYKRFFVDNIKSYPHDEILYLFKKDLINKINNTTMRLLIKLGLDVSKEALINNILELTTNDDRKLMEAAIRLYNEL